MRGQPWYPGETLIAGIGQGFDLVTPLQLAVATATMASHGRHFLPRVVQTVSDLKSGHDIVLRIEEYDTVRTIHMNEDEVPADTPASGFRRSTNSGPSRVRSRVVPPAP